MITENPICIAIADNQPIVRHGLINTLSEYGINCIAEAGNGLDLIARIEAAPALPDICFVDIMMPGQDGYDTVKILNDRWPSVKSIVFTMLHNEYSMVRMISNGAKGYLLKDASIKEIHAAIIEVQSSGFYLSATEITGPANTKSTRDFHKYFFSKTEIQFIKYCCSELTYKEIATMMHTSLHTIDNYRNDLFSKLKLKSRTGLVMFALSAGIISV